MQNFIIQNNLMIYSKRNNKEQKWLSRQLVSNYNGDGFVSTLFVKDCSNVFFFFEFQVEIVLDRSEEEKEMDTQRGEERKRKKTRDREKEMNNGKNYYSFTRLRSFPNEWSGCIAWIITIIVELIQSKLINERAKWSDSTNITLLYRHDTLCVFSEYEWYDKKRLYVFIHTLNKKNQI